MKKEEMYEYDKEKREKAKKYSFSKLISGIINSIILPIIALLVILWTGLAQQFASFLQRIMTIYLAAPMFIIALALFLSAIQFPLELYFGYFYEHKYDLSNQSLHEWFKDYLKSLGLNLLFSVIVFSVVFSLLNTTEYWWVFAWIFLTLLTIFIEFIFPILILPIFYNLEPHQNEEHREKLIDMCKEAGVKEVNSVMVADQSRKSSKPNAMFTGLGNTKSIVLFDTLVNKFKNEEIEAVVGHELGHYLNKDIIKLILGTSTLSFILLYLIDWLLTINLFGISQTGLEVIPLLLLLSSVFQIVIMPIVNHLSRWREFLADRAAIKFSGSSRALISTFKRMADLSLSDDDPHWLAEMLIYTHPSVKRRIQNIKKNTK